MALYLRKEWLDNELDNIDLTAISAAVQKHELTGNKLLGELKTREQQMLQQVFGTSITQDQFLKNYENLRQSYPSLDKLTMGGISLIVLKYAATTGDQSDKDRFLVTSWLQQTLQDEIDKNPETLKDLGEFAAQAIVNTANEGFEIAAANSNVKQRHVSRKPLAFTSLEKGASLEQVLAVSVNKIGTRTAERLRAAIGAKAGQEFKQSPKFNAKKTSSGMSINFKVPMEWYGYNQGLSGRQVSEQSNSEQLITKANEAFKHDLIQYIGPGIPHLNEIVDYMLKKHPKSLFVGGNEEAIVGFLGELRAMCYMALLLGDNFKLSSEVLNWTAKSTRSDVGRQAHADITVLEEFGIQVKNTIKSITDTVQFRNLKFATFLETLVKNGVITDDQKAELLTIFEAYYFNVPYWYSQMIHDNNKHLPEGQKQQYAISVVSNPDFADTRARIEMMKITAQQIISSMLVELFYVGTGNAAKDEAGNILFFIDDRLIFASTVVKAIQEEIRRLEDNLDSICVVAYPDQGPTIVSAINENNIGIISRASSGPKIEPSVLNALQFRSAFDFSVTSLRR